MFAEVYNPEDHKDHDPSKCDYARIWLTQQFVSGKHVQLVSKLTDEQLIVVCFKSALYSTYPTITETYLIFGLNSKNLFDFSEYIRSVLAHERGFDKLLSPKNMNVSLN